MSTVMVKISWLWVVGGGLDEHAVRKGCLVFSQMQFVLDLLVVRLLFWLQLLLTNVQWQIAESVCMKVAWYEVRRLHPDLFGVFLLGPGERSVNSWLQKLDSFVFGYFRCNRFPAEWDLVFFWKFGRERERAFFEGHDGSWCSGDL